MLCFSQAQPFAIGEQPELDVVALEPVSGEERLLRAIAMHEYDKHEDLRKKAQRPYERWMRTKVVEAFEKEGTVR